MKKSASAAGNTGFTLIELSIVLVIIGLIVGGVLVGRDMIAAAGIRAQISQIEKYQTAVNTFRGKYGYLPGDIPDPAATNFGFMPRGTLPGMGDGDGTIEGINAYGPGQNGILLEGAGEAVLFWVDLGTAGLISGTFPGTTAYGAAATVSTSQIPGYMPAAVIGGNNFIYAYNGGPGADVNTGKGDERNYFGLSASPTMAYSQFFSNRGTSVTQAYNMDVKIDDGFPQSGNVTSSYLNYLVLWANFAQVSDTWPSNFPFTLAVTPSPTTCFDNGNITGVQKYSMGQNNGAGINCALSFRFQ